MSQELLVRIIITCKAIRERLALLLLQDRRNGIYLPYWTPENKSNIYPAVTFNPDSRYLGLQSRGYLRLQRLSLSYALSKGILDSIGINSLTIGATAENLLTITRWDGGDPEAGIAVASSAYPVTTNYSVGINLSF